MRIFGLAGWSGSGKTTLMTALIPEFVVRGITVSTIKHAHHAFDVDQPGKDSWRHRQAGAQEVMVASGRRWALMHELRGAPEPALDELAGADDPGRSAAGRRVQASPASEARGLPPRARESRHCTRTTRLSSRSHATSDCPGSPCPGCRSRRGGDRQVHPASRWAGPMAQLSDDCFAFGGALLSVDAALARIEERVVAGRRDRDGAAGRGAGRILAATIGRAR